MPTFCYFAGLADLADDLGKPGEPAATSAMVGVGDNSAEASYYTSVDQHSALGLGNDVPISTGNVNDALLALVEGKWVILRVPYRLRLYAKDLDLRIDDPSAG